jgi:hypothetical protein
MLSIEIAFVKVLCKRKEKKKRKKEKKKEKGKEKKYINNKCFIPFECFYVALKKV